MGKESNLSWYTDNDNEIINLYRISTGKNVFDCSVEKNVLYTARNQYVSSDTLFKQGTIKISYL